MEGQRAVVYDSGASGVVHWVLQRFSLSKVDVGSHILFNYAVPVKTAEN
jgi:hypothetical protein